MTAGFLLLTGGLFLARSGGTGSYTFMTQRSATSYSASEGGGEEARPHSLLEGERICLNTAGEGDLRRLPGIGEKKARAIMEYRETHGPFRSVEDLLQVSGIGPGILAGLRDYVTVD